MSVFDYNNQNDAEDLVSIEGHVKWFDAAKGYGFIVPQDSAMTSQRDVLLHISSLRDLGRDTAAEGARIHCKIARRTKGWQVIEIDHLDAQGEILPMSQRHEAATPRSSRVASEGVRVGD